MLILSDSASSAATNPTVTLTRGSSLAELTIPAPGYVITGAKTIQVEVKE